MQLNTMRSSVADVHLKRTTNFYKTIPFILRLGPTSYCKPAAFETIKRPILSCDATKMGDDTLMLDADTVKERTLMYRADGEFGAKHPLRCTSH